MYYASMNAVTVTSVSSKRCEWSKLAFMIDIQYLAFVDLAIYYFSLFKMIPRRQIISALKLCFKMM